MTLQSFRQLLAKRPFEPFRIVVSSGEAYEVRHPEMAFLTRTALHIGLNPDQEGIAEDATWCSLFHVTAVESLNQRDNGTKGRGLRKKG
jgi:hypothetical protein